MHPVESRGRGCCHYPYPDKTFTPSQGGVFYCPEVEVLGVSELWSR